MLDLFRKSFLIGLGALAVSKEKLEEVVDELAAKGEMNREEAKRVAKELMEKGKKEGEAFRSSVRKELEDLRRRAGTVTQGDIDRLAERIAVIEAKLGITPPPPPEEGDESQDEEDQGQAGEEDTAPQA